jgi:hypothetical protein
MPAISAFEISMMNFVNFDENLGAPSQTLVSRVFRTEAMGALNAAPDQNPLPLIASLIIAPTDWNWCHQRES